MDDADDMHFIALSLEVWPLPTVHTGNSDRNAPRNVCRTRKFASVYRVEEGLGFAVPMFVL
jgi:hypothetical protein